MTYGSDFKGVEDIDFALTFREGEAQEQEALVEAVARRYLTPFGGLWYSKDYGCDIRNFLCDSTPLPVAEGLIQAEARREERVRKATAKITVGDDGAWFVFIQVFGDEGGEFPLTFKVTTETIERL